MTLSKLLPALLAVLVAGCASLPDHKPDKRDPFEAYNRWMFGVNDAVDRGVVHPTAKAYVRVVPQPVRTSVSNFFSNLAYPRTIVNDLLQAKLADGGRDTVRLVVNSVLGLGLFDPATRLGLERHNEDFGQTLGKWGVPSGPYLVLPALGPSTVRDAFGRVPDEYSTARHYIRNSTLKWSLIAIDVVDARAGLLETDSVLKESFDPYAFVRNSWLRHREFQVRDGDVPDDAATEAAP